MGRKKDTRCFEKVIEEDFSYDPELGEVYRKGKVWGSSDSRGYLVGNVKTKRSVKVHRLAWFIYYGVWPTYGIDHINRIKDDNRIINLRDVPQKVNCSNKNLRSDNKSGYENVSWDRVRGKWCVRKHINGSYKFLGYFNCPTSAFVMTQKMRDENDTTRDG